MPKTLIWARTGIAQLARLRRHKKKQVARTQRENKYTKC